MSIKKQFIAGAKCTACGAEDKVRLCREEEREWIECVACGHSEERPKTVVPKEPDEIHGSSAGPDGKEAGGVKWVTGKR